jgi:hypothetical protein
MMTSKQSLPSQLGRSVDKSPYAAQEALLKVSQPPKGSGIIVGRAKRSKESLENLAYVGQVIESTLGRSYLGSGVWLDIDFPHVIYISGTRGSGKSFDLGVLIEGISTLAAPSVTQHAVTPQCSILLDMQNQFWTLAYEPRANIPENAEQLNDLKAWNLAPNRLVDCHVFIPQVTEPFTQSEERFTLSASDVLPEEWCALVDQPLYSPQGHVISACVERFGTDRYSLADMIRFIESDANLQGTADATRSAVIYKLRDVERTQLFSRDGLDVKTLLQPGRCNIFMIRDLRNEDKAIVASIIARQLFRVMGQHHARRKVKAFFDEQGEANTLPNKVWLFIDEAHIVAPNDRPSPAREALVEYVKRGRDAGLSLVLATQQPSAIDDRILSQVNLSFNHRLTFQSDISAAINRVPTKTLSGLKIAGATITDFGDMLRLLDAGECFVGDHSTSRTIISAIRPRITSHGGYNPS